MMQHRDKNNLKADLLAPGILAPGFLALAGFFASEAHSAENPPDQSNLSLPSIQTIFDSVQTIEIPAIKLLFHENFPSLTQQEKESAFYIFNKLNQQGQDCFLKLMQSRDWHNNELVVTRSDFFGEAFLDNLKKLIDTPMHPAFEGRREEIINSFMCELSNPGELSQEAWGVCGTSMVYGLYGLYPSEGVRIMTGLLSPEGEVDLLKEGKKLSRAPFSLIPDRIGTRSITEQVMFSALMEFANGEHEHYCNVCDLSYDLESGAGYVGLALENQTELIKAVYNIPDDKCGFFDISDGYMAEDFLKNYMPGMIFASLRWETGNPGPATYHKLNLHTESADNHISVSSVSTGGSADSYHMITILNYDDKKIYFHNLHGSRGYAKGAFIANPPRHIEDPEKGIQSMEITVFKSRVKSILVPYYDKKIPMPQCPVEVVARGKK